MGFIYADELKKEFDVFGHFYDLNIKGQKFKCRSVLEIVRKGFKGLPGQPPNAVVIMMNPGSSRPNDKNYKEKVFSLKEIESANWPKELVSTRPDNAQYQIMRVMLDQNWKHVRVLNLSDLRDGSSGCFQKKFLTAAALCSYHPHSMFNQKRRKELLSSVAMRGKKIIIVAWGSLNVLNGLAKEALGALDSNKVIGINHDGKETSFRHASPYRKDQKLKWLQGIQEKINKIRSQNK